MSVALYELEQNNFVMGSSPLKAASHISPLMHLHVNKWMDIDLKNAGTTRSTAYLIFNAIQFVPKEVEGIKRTKHLKRWWNCRVNALFRSYPQIFRGYQRPKGSCINNVNSKSGFFDPHPSQLSSKQLVSTSITPHHCKRHGFILPFLLLKAFAISV